MRARYLLGLEAEEASYRAKQRAYTTALKAAPTSVGYRGEMGPGHPAYLLTMALLTMTLLLACFYLLWLL